MNVEYRVLGPLEALVDGRPAKLGGPKQRATLALLLMQANTVVPAARLVDGLWIEDPPASATHLVQGYVSGVRKVLGKSALETRDAGYVLRVDGAALDLHRFERRLQEGSRALDARGTARRPAPAGGARSLARRRSPISRTSLRSTRPSAGSRSCAFSRSSAYSTRGSRSGSMRSSSRRSSSSWRTIRCGNDRAGSW